MTFTMLQLPTNQIPVGSIDFVEATVTDANGSDLDMGVEIAITRDGALTHTWLPAEWEGDPAATRNCRTASVVDTDLLDDADPTMSGTRYAVYVRLDNGAAHPIVQVGWIVLTD